jgi:acylphosphatase
MIAKMLIEACIIVRGIVQGVAFRIYTQRQARLLGLNGYVRNLASGDVEIVAQGESGAVDRLIAWARRGPPAARVDDVRVEYRKPTVDYGGFDIQ